MKQQQELPARLIQEILFEEPEQTRRFNEALGETTAMRSKEDAHDYRYFPDPDIPPIILTEEELDEIRSSIPELPEQRVARYVEQCGIKKQDADLIVSDKKICENPCGYVQRR